MVVKSISFEKVDWVSETGEKFDIDRYIVEIRKPLSTQDYVLNVDHKDKKLFGDVVRYGSWDDLDTEEIVEILELVEAEGKLVRPFREYI